MAHADVSFTFLDRVREIEQNIADRRWQSALALALTLPDICGGIAFPEIVRKIPGWPGDAGPSEQPHPGCRGAVYPLV